MGHAPEIMLKYMENIETGVEIVEYSTISFAPAGQSSCLAAHVANGTQGYYMNSSCRPEATKSSGALHGP